MNVSASTLTRLPIGMMIALISFSVSGAGKDPVATLPVHQDKSTLETFSLQSLDTEGLADAVIGGALDAPAAGEEIDAPDTLRKKNNETSEDLIKREFAVAPRPQLNVPEPRLPMVTHKQSNYDVLNITPR